MTLDETIQLLEEDVIMYKHYEHEMKNRGWEIESVMCKEGADERQQLAEWLKELKRLREQTKMIPVMKRLPEEDGEYLCTIQTRSIYTDKFIDTYINFCDFMDGGWGVFDDETVVAWMPLPEPYKAESED